MPTIVFLSDTHQLHEYIDVPPGDILIHSGDFCTYGKLDEVKRFADWFASLPHSHKILVAGNHDWPFQRQPEEALRILGDDIHYLEDSAVWIGGLTFYGSPWQPEFNDWAFNVPRGPLLAEKWSHIPNETNVLITHGPPAEILDLTDDGLPVGCVALAERVKVVQPKYHLFGHIHHSYGARRVGKTWCINGSICDEAYRPTRKPWVIEI